jgi:hypothetical protein
VRAWVVLALFLLGATQNASRATTTQIQLSARSSSVTVLDLPRGGAIRDDTWQLAGSGSYQIAVVDRVVHRRTFEGDRTVIVIRARALGDRLRVMGNVFHSHVLILPAGRYRITLVSDRPMTFRVNIGGPGMRRQATDATGGVRQVSRVGSPDLPLMSESANRIERGSRTLLIDLVGWRARRLPLVSAFDVQVCLRRANESTCTGPGGSAAAVDQRLVIEDHWIGYASYFETNVDPFVGTAELRDTVRAVNEVLQEQRHVTIALPG